MTEREEKILIQIIKEYTRTALPVGSKHLAEKLNCSSATVRNEMNALEEEGYIVKPHTSAGRIPTDEGYRYFVNLLNQEKPLSVVEQEKLQADFLKMQAQYKKLARVTAKLLASYSESVVISGSSKEKDFTSSGMSELLRQPEFSDKKEIEKVFNTVDRFDEVVSLYLEPQASEKKSDPPIQTYIGKENPIKEVQNCSLIISDFELENGERGVIAVLGPKRMRYERNLSLVAYLTKLLSSGSLFLLMILSGAVIN